MAGYFKSEEDIKMWFDDEKNLIQKPNKIVYKLSDEMDHFVKSCIVPTDMYPLNDSTFEVFHYRNTEWVQDPKILSLFDKAKYEVGRCYSNVDGLFNIFESEGYEITEYVGWLFLGTHEYPIHHCWAVLRLPGGGQSVLDLADDTTVLYMNLQNDPSLEMMDAKEMMVSYYMSARKQKNSARCFPVGNPTPTYFYVGCPCKPAKGIEIFRELLRKYPDHETARNCDRNGLNQTQKMIKYAIRHEQQSEFLGGQA